MAQLPVAPNDRVLLRDRPWRVQLVTPVTENRKLLELEALDGDYPSSLSVVVPPDEVVPLPNEEVVFDLRGLDSFAAWSRSHRILAATLVQETGLLSGARFGRVALEAYQLAPVLRVLSKPRPSLLVADDVGLGKTIEAGLVALELMARGRANRILVVTPAGLMDQWRDELYEKFGLVFKVIGNAADLAQAQTELPAGVSPWEALPRVITSVDFIKKETVRNRALRKRWDLVIVDEAHALAESGTPENPYRTQRTRLGYALRKASRGLLLLTATPHNGYVHSFRSLLELVEPTLATFRGSSEDRQRRIEAARIRRMKSQIKRRLSNGDEEPVFPQRVVTGIPVTQLTEADKNLLHKVAAYCSRASRDAEKTEEAELISFAMQIIKKRALSSRAALANTIEHRLEALEKEEAREEPPEKAELRDYQADLPLSEAAMESTARKILRSAIPADERRRQYEIRTLKSLRKLLRKAGDADPKIEVLIQEIKGIQSAEPGEKVIVFTEYRDTLEAIRQRLEQEPVLAQSYVVLTGGLSRGQRLQRQEQFSRPEVRVLLATDAASEGLNLQPHCRRVIHFELPWNPNRLEQRNGRVDRYGQTRQPVIRYLYYPDSPEDDVLARLAEKIEQMAKDFVSTPDVLGVLTGEERIQEGLVHLDPESPEVEQDKNALVKLFEDRTREFVRNVQPLLPASAGVPQETERILNLLSTSEPLLPDDEELEKIVLEILSGSATPVPELGEEIFRVEVPLAYRNQGVKPVYPALTFRRSVAIRYSARDVEYVTPIHPLVQSLARDARRRLLQVYPAARGLPPRRLAARVVDSDEPPSVLFTFLATIRGEGGLLEERLLAVRVSTEGRVRGDPVENLGLLVAEKPGDVPREMIESLFASVFDSLRERASSEAVTWAIHRAAEIRQRREEQAALLRRDLETDVTDRLREIDEEELRARGLVKQTGQIALFAESESDARRFDARREAVKSYREERLGEIAEFERVDEPSPPRPLGALFLVPAGGMRR